MEKVIYNKRVLTENLKASFMAFDHGHALEVPFFCYPGRAQQLWEKLFCKKSFGESLNG